jgi:4-aminobutyrate aminotransferase
LVWAIKQQIDALGFAPRRFTNEPSVLLGEKLTRRFWDGDSRLLLATGGSDAIEIALRLSRAATRRSGIIAINGSYHGHGFASLALSSAVLDQRLGSQLPDIHHVAPYWDKEAGGADRMLADIERIFATAPDTVACFIAEPMRSNCITPPPHLWPEVSRLCKRAGAKLIFDEIPSGLGKTGRFFAHEHYDVRPDVVVLGKALGGGILPIAAVLAHKHMAVAPELTLGHYTHEKNPVTSRAALTTIEIIEDERLIEQAERLGQYTENYLRDSLKKRLLSPLREVRGLGLMLALTLQPGKLPAGVSSEDLVKLAMQKGVSTTTKGAMAIGFSPPLVISEQEIRLAIDRIVEAAATQGQS